MPSPEALGSIYDLGYRRYTGRRLGRTAAVLALYRFSLRASFGFGRRATARIIPIGLGLITLLPALVQLGIASIAPGDFDVIKHEEYYGMMQIVLALFAAAVAPELVGRDQRTRTLSLYFSRPLERTDYALAKYLALVTAMLVLTFGPQMLMFLGNGFAEDAFGQYLRDEWKLIPQIAASALFFSLFVSAIAIVIAAYIPRRAFATVTNIGVFLVTTVLAAVFIGISQDGLGRWFVFLSPFETLQGATYWIFRADAPSGETLSEASFPLVSYVISGAAFTALCSAVLYRRYRSLQP